jgi:uncharacterized protein YyaL (SSP411 family)
MMTWTAPPSLILCLVAVALAVTACQTGASQEAHPAAAKGKPSTGPTTHPANRLAKEKSPYLLQHAHNPVDWYPWGDEAFARAKRENKPIFLSIGYSTCHWCHVMERESFEDPAVAKLINDHFVAVKVDREERPDVDRVYMTFVQASTGSGGWPMTVFLTPDLKPFYGGTYFPPEDRRGMVGMKTLVPRVAKAWEEDREKIVQSADRVTEAIKKFSNVEAGEGEVGVKQLDACYKALAETFDAANGGFGSSPKFPEPSNPEFLFHYWRRTGQAKARDMALVTLRKMALGGMYDHLGGGFHRYSTDERWFLPHFEKMLYDQAQLVELYLDAYAITKDAFYADVARGVMEYVLRDLTGDSGQFYSAEDADSATDPANPREKTEGAFYVWTAAEVRKALGKEAGDVFLHHYGAKDKGNVDKDPHGEFPSKNVLYVAEGIAETAKQFRKTPQEVEKLLAESRKKLFELRNARPRPHRDDKTLVAWNGLMISAAARAGQVLQEPRYTEAAVRAATFVRDKLYDPQTHQLTRRWRDGHADVAAFLDDYAYFTQGLIDLYECTLDVQWLKTALALQSKQDEQFWDKEAGGYFSTTGKDASVILRMRDDSDGAEPSANSISLMNLLRLSQMTDDKALRERAEQTVKPFTTRLRQTPVALPHMLAAVDFMLDKPKQVVIAGNPGAADTKAMLREVHARYLPNKVILAADRGEGQQFLTSKMEFIKTITPIGSKATAYVCENYACQLPTNDLAALAKQLDGSGSR